MALYAFFRPCGLEAALESALLSNQADELTKWSAPLEKAFIEIKEWSLFIGGKTLSTFGDQICIEIPVEKLPDLSTFLRKFEFTTKMLFSVGVGMGIMEAYKAMLSSEHADGTKIVLYSEDLESEESLEKAQGNEGFNFEFPNLELEKEDAEEQAQPTQDAPSQQPKPTAKQKIVDALMMIKQKAPIIAQLKQVDPQAYEAVKKMVDAMVSLAHGDLDKSEQELDKHDLLYSQVSPELTNGRNVWNAEHDHGTHQIHQNGHSSFSAWFKSHTDGSDWQNLGEHPTFNKAKEVSTAHSRDVAVRGV